MKFKALIFGTGEIAKEILPLAKRKYEVLAFMDNNESKWDSEFEGLPIYSPKKIAEIDYDMIVVTAVAGFNAVVDQLLGMGVQYENIVDCKSLPLQRQETLEIYKRIDEKSEQINYRIDNICQTISNQRSSQLAMEKAMRFYNLIIRENTSDFDTFWQVMIDEVYQHPFKINPKIILDLGANVGYSAVYFTKMYPNAKIFSLEPDNSNFEVLRQNTAKYLNINILHGAVYDKTTILSVMDNNLGEWGRTVAETESNINQQVQAYTMSDLLRIWDLESETIDIMKIDIEGSEKELFEADTSWLNKVRHMFIETHDRFKYGSTHAVFTKLLPYSFQMAIRGDGLVFSNISKPLKDGI